MRADDVENVTGSNTGNTEETTDSRIEETEKTEQTEETAVTPDVPAQAEKTDEKTEAENRKRRKKKMLIALIVIAVLGGVSYVLLEHQELFDLAQNTVTEKVTNMYSDKLVSYIFYPADFDMDVTENETYMGLDRNIYYRSGAETVSISEDGAESSYSNGVLFFKKYFDTVINGDYETYNTYFTDNYYTTNSEHEMFAPQMIYDILVDELSVTPNTDGTTTYAFDVSYKIYRNNGTFRNDIDSDASKKLYFELIEDASGNVLIDRITYYVR